MSILSDVLSVAVPLFLLCAFIPEIPIIMVENIKSVWNSVRGK